MDVEEDLIEPEEILEQRIIDMNGARTLQLLVKWKGKSAEEATWMFYVDIANQFPH